MNKNIEEINKIRELQLSKRKQVEESNKKLQLENEERNRVLKEVDEIKNKWIEAVKKYDINLSEEENKSKMSPKEIVLCNADYLELPIKVDEKYFKYIEEGYGLYPYNRVVYSCGCTDNVSIKNTKLFFTERERNRYKTYVSLNNGHKENKNIINVSEQIVKDNNIGESFKNESKDIKECKNDETNKTENNKTDIEPLIRFIVDGKDVSEEEYNNKLKELEQEIIKSFGIIDKLIR